MEFIGHMKRLVIFDFDGVLVQTEFAKINSFQQTLYAYGIFCKQEELAFLTGMTHEDFIMHLDQKFSSNEKYQIHHNEIISHKENFDYKKLVTIHVKDLLKEMKKRNIHTAVASNSSLKRLSGALKVCQIDSYIDFICSGTDEGKIKPDPFIYNKTMKHFNVNAEETIIVEDSKLGIDAAVQSGAFVMAFHNHNIKIDQSKSNIQITNLLEILKYLD